MAAGKRTPLGRAIENGLREYAAFKRGEADMPGGTVTPRATSRFVVASPKSLSAKGAAKPARDGASGTFKAVKRRPAREHA